MKSTTGQHFLPLDHLRALAAFMVFVWHFTHGPAGSPVPFDGTPFAVPPLALLDEGHTGVALFMTLSGYLFARLLANKRVDYRLFLYNRMIRLLPLLLAVYLVVGVIQVRPDARRTLIEALATGIILPSIPNGGWSITAEFHFYLLLPLLLYLARRSRLSLLAIVASAIAFRMLWYLHTGSIQRLAYLTIVGRVDQFVLGMLSAYLFPAVRRKGLAAAAAGAGLVAFYTWFDAAGGFFQLESYPSTSAIWIILPTIEGLSYAAVIGWYDAWQRSTTPLSRAWGKVGEYSYSIYLLHFFVVFRMAAFIHTRVADLSNFYVALAWSVPAFLLVTAVAGCSYHAIELPFLRHRRNYLRPAPVASWNAAAVPGDGGRG